MLQPFTVTVGISDKYDPKDSVALPQYSEATLVQFSVTGLTRMYWNWPAESLGRLDTIFDARGRPAGSQCFVQFIAWYQTGGTLSWGGCIGAQSQDTLRLTRLVNGMGRAKWTGRYPQGASACDYGPCWYYEGDKVLTIEPVQAELTLTSSAPAVTPGTPVTFTARVTPDTVETKPVPFRVTRWKFIRDSGDSTTPCSLPPVNTNPALCTFTPAGSGQLVVEAKVNTVPLVERRRVSVVPCLVGDTLLDDSRLRRALNDALTASNPNSSPWNRLERGGVRFQMPDGGVRDSLFPPGPNDTPCSFNTPDLTGLPGTPILTWHTHPFRPADPNDPLPYDPNRNPRSNCPQLDTLPAPPPGHVYAAGAGPSRADSSVVGPHVIVDRSNVWLIPSPDDPDQSIRHYPRVGGGVCDPLSL